MYSRILIRFFRILRVHMDSIVSIRTATENDFLLVYIIGSVLRRVHMVGSDHRFGLNRYRVQGTRNGITRNFRFTRKFSISEKNG